MFVDGLGIGGTDPAVNPLAGDRYPQLKKLIADAIPLDACLGVEGLPQSATGQAALLTGINAPEIMGRHIEGFPPPALKKLIQHENIFAKLNRLGKTSTFANAYWIDDPHRIPLRRQSVTTVMTLSVLGGVRHKNELLSGKAVNHDITRWTMHTRGYTGELISPETAAAHLLNIARDFDFTLFEYFLTDHAGHSGNTELIETSLGDLERFIPEIAAFSEKPNHLFLLCSDHGNIENIGIFTHTRNPVPLVALGTGSETFRSCTKLTDVSPAILKAFKSC